MGAAPRVSVVIPVFNSSRLAARSVESVLAQTHRDLEVLLIDDGSDPEEAEALERLAEGERVRVLRQPNQGPARARRHGWEAARGDFVAMLDCDDRQRPHYLERCLAALDADPSPHAVYTRYVWMDPRTGQAGRVQPERASSGWIFDQEVRKARVKLSTLMVRRSELLALQGLREDLRHGETYDLVLRLALRIRFAFVPEVLVEVYREPGSLSRPGQVRQSFLNRVEVLRAVERSFPGMPSASRALLRRKMAHYYLKTAERSARRHDHERSVELCSQAFRTHRSLRTLRRYAVARIGRLLKREPG